MAGQTLAESSELKRPVGRAPRKPSILRRKLVGAWQIGLCWARYFLFGADRGVPGLVDFVLGNHLFRAQQMAHDLTALGEILSARRLERALEIGTAHGGTLFFLTRLAIPCATIVSVDLPGGRFGGGYTARRAWFYKRFAQRGQRLHLLRGDSHGNEMLERVKAALGGQALDYLFIDGDHTYDGVKRDFELYVPLVRKGGIVVLHDIAEHPPALGCEVSRFWKQVKSKYRHTEIIRDLRQGWGGIGVLYVD